MNFTVTGMKAEHISEIARLEKECFSSPWSEKALAQELSNPDSHFLVAESDGVAGYIGVQEICGEAYITNIAVFGNFRKLTVKYLFTVASVIFDLSYCLCTSDVCGILT